VLNQLEAIKAVTQYHYNGKHSTELPYDLCNVEMETLSESFPGWQLTLEGIERFDDLPTNAKTYITFLEEHLEVPVSMISTGPERKKLIKKEVGVFQ